MKQKYQSVDIVTQGQTKWIRSVIKGELPRIICGIFLSLLAVSLQLLNPWPLKILLDSVFGNTPAPLFLHDMTGTYGLLAVVGFGYVGLYLVSGLLEIIDSYLTTRFTNSLSIRLQSSFYYHVLNLPVQTRSKVDSGDYVYRLNEQADNLPALIFGTLVSVITNVFTIIAALLILALLNYQMALVGLLIIPMLFFSIRYFSPKIEAKSDEIAIDTSDIYNQTSESLENVTLIQSFNRQRFQTNQLTQLLRGRAKKSLALTMLSQKFEYSNNIFTASGVAIVLLVGGHLVFQNKITIGELLVFVTYMSYLYDPIEGILSSLGTYKELLAGVKRVYGVLAEPAEDPDDSNGIRYEQKARGAIVFDNVTFNRKGRPILNQVSFTIEPGQKVAFVGPSGSGKSTILSLIPRFNRADSGFIYLDGHEVNQINLASLRDQFGIVSQEPELFSGTIHQNIGFAIPEEQLDLPDIMAAAQAANAADFIQKLPDGFETEVGEGGSNLSGGQKQRISIARAFVKNAPILILDEPTSALDRTASTKIVAAIKKLMEGKTVLLATHETTLLKEMDIVYVIDRGSIRKIDTNAELAHYIESLTNIPAETDKLQLF